MGTKDIVEKHLEEYDDVFADIINVLLFGGKQIVKEEELENGTAKAQYKTDKDTVHEQERDVAKFWKHGLVKIAIYGLENQTSIDKDMPLRIMGYDGQNYRSQLLKENKKTQGSKRYPVVTLVLYFGMARWKNYRSLHEVLEIPEELKPYVSDYKINVFEIAYLEEEQVKLFQSDFKYVADYFVQMRKNRNYIPSKETMRHVDEVLKIMSILTEDTRFLEVQNSGKKEVKSMCEVLDQVEQRGIQQGIQQGFTQGIQQGISQGILEGQAKQIIEMGQEFGLSKEQILERLQNKLQFSKEEAMKYFK